MILSLRHMAVVAPVLVMLAASVGCGDESGTGGSAGSGAASSSSASSSSAGGSGGMGTGGAGGGTGGMGGMGTGGAGGGTGGSGGMMLTCDGGKEVDNRDGTKRCSITNEVNTPIMAPASVKWADKVIAVSSEYGTQPGNYSATKALGAPDIYPAGGDEPNAWTSKTEDAPTEFLTLGFSTPVVGEAVWIYETFNPGAISKVTISTKEGDKVIYQNMMTQPIGVCSYILAAPTKTCSPISAVRVDLTSDKVAGYNEIDAIGILPPK